jgi:hypothetical protein
MVSSSAKVFLQFEPLDPKATARLVLPCEADEPGG